MLAAYGSFLSHARQYYNVTGLTYRAKQSMRQGLLDRDKTHVWKESREFWRTKLSEHGFTVLIDNGLWRYSLFGRYYLFWGGKSWRNFSPAILLIGEK